MPKAFLNWILLDERFNYVASSSGFDQVGASLAYTTHTCTDLPISKSGYLYIYVSNATPNMDVFFDNLQVTHIRGPLLEENSYYPFGLTMKGISSKALGFGNPDNKIKFQNQEFASKEFSDGTGLEMYEFKYRMHDPQIGRFWSIDPLSDKYVYNSTYAFSENHVTSHVELEGLEKVSINESSTVAGAIGAGAKIAARTIKTPVLTAVTTKTSDCHVGPKDWGESNGSSSQSAGGSSRNLGRGGIVLTSEFGGGNNAPKGTTNEPPIKADLLSLMLGSFMPVDPNFAKTWFEVAEKLPERLEQGSDLVEKYKEAIEKLKKPEEVSQEIPGGGSSQMGQTENDVTRRTVFRRMDNKHFYNKTVIKGTLQNGAQIDDSLSKVIPAKDGSGVDTINIWNKKRN